MENISGLYCINEIYLRLAKHLVGKSQGVYLVVDRKCFCLETEKADC